MYLEAERAEVDTFEDRGGCSTGLVWVRKRDGQHVVAWDQCWGTKAGDGTGTALRGAASAVRGKSLPAPRGEAPGVVSLLLSNSN